MRAALIALGLLVASQMALAQSCPTPLASANRMLLVVPRSINSTVAFSQRFSRPLPLAPWRPAAGPFTALLGGENVRRVRQYRQGLLVDYRTDRAPAPAGASSFIPG